MSADIVPDFSRESQDAIENIKYTSISGFFQQDDPEIDGRTFDYIKENLGLVDREYETDHEFDPGHVKSQWQRFEAYVDHLNTKAKPAVNYKLLYLGRHGEGHHNVAEAKYGTPEWDCYWSKLPGDATANWTDSRLTDTGLGQAAAANKFWADKMETDKIPVPQSYYTSPLTRCLQTADTTFSGLSLPENYPFQPTVKELLREVIGIHTCDKRSSRTYIHAEYPSFPIETGFAENDEMWQADLRETDSAIDSRLKRLLDDVFMHDQQTFISFTCHSGTIAAILRVVGHQAFSLATGAVIPVLLKGVRVTETAPSTSAASSTGAQACTATPSTVPGPAS